MHTGNRCAALLEVVIMRKTWLIVSLIVVGLLANTGFAQQTKRALTKITGDVYRFQNKFHFSVFTITGNGVVVTDPINAEAAAWLRTEIGKLTDQPITHLVYSHSHGDHASGGAAFGDVPNVAFPCAALHDEATDELKVYYGGADTCVCLATTTLTELVTFIKEHDMIDG